MLRRRLVLTWGSLISGKFQELVDCDRFSCRYAIYTCKRYIVLDLEMKKKNILIRNEKSKNNDAE